jgi:hypothetical protein
LEISQHMSALGKMNFRRANGANSRLQGANGAIDLM